jgi:hypothetical protein
MLFLERLSAREAKHLVFCPRNNMTPKYPGYPSFGVNGNRSRCQIPAEAMGRVTKTEARKKGE